MGSALAVEAAQGRVAPLWLAVLGIASQALGTAIIAAQWLGPRNDAPSQDRFAPKWAPPEAMELATFRRDAAPGPTIAGPVALAVGLALQVLSATLG
jgi:hypothetical protein